MAPFNANFCLWDPSQLNCSCKFFFQGRKIASLQRSPTNRVRPSGSMILLETDSNVSAFLLITYEAEREQSQVGTWRQKHAEEKEPCSGSIDTRCPLPRSWIERLLSLPLPRNNPLREKGVKAPQKSREFVPLIGNGNLGCFFIGDAAGFTGFFVCWFWGLFSPGPIPKKQRY